MTLLRVLVGSRPNLSTDIYGKIRLYRRCMAWGKHGDLEVEYSLGDDDPFDKFIIHVSSDKRFGTPLFKTIGGASKCPGEPNTMASGQRSGSRKRLKRLA